MPTVRKSTERKVRNVFQVRRPSSSPSEGRNLVGPFLKNLISPKCAANIEVTRADM